MIVISDKDTASKQADDFDFVISILDERYHWGHNFGSDKHLIVHFEDTEHPTEKQYANQFLGVSRIFNWVRQNKITSDHRVLVHCHAGISRSSAVAWLLLVDQGVEPLQAFQTLLKARPRIWPNTSVMLIGDKLMQKQGGLIRLAQKVDLEISESRSGNSGYSG